jgi:hypothetical protein
VNRGPQLVQLMNGYRNRRSAGSSSSLRHSAHTLVSAVTAASGARPVRGHHPIEDRQRRGVARQPRQKLPHRALAPLHLHQDAVRVVEHEPPESELPGQAIDVRAKSDALNGPVNAHLSAAAGRHRGRRAHPTSSRSAWYALACASWMRGMCSERVTITWSASASPAIRPPS